MVAQDHLATAEHCVRPSLAAQGFLDQAYGILSRLLQLGAQEAQIQSNPSQRAIIEGSLQRIAAVAASLKSQEPQILHDGFRPIRILAFFKNTPINNPVELSVAASSEEDDVAVLRRSNGASLPSPLHVVGNTASIDSALDDGRPTEIGFLGFPGSQNPYLLAQSPQNSIEQALDVLFRGETLIEHLAMLGARLPPPVPRTGRIIGVCGNPAEAENFFSLETQELKHGESGGPVFTSDAEIVGIVSHSRLLGSEHTHLAARSDSLARMMRKAGISLPEPLPQFQLETDRQREPGRPIRTTAGILAGVSAVFAVTGGALMGYAGSQFNRLDDACSFPCPESEWSAYREQERAGVGLLITAGAVAALDVALWLIDARRGNVNNGGRPRSLLTAPTTNGLITVRTW